MYKLLTIAIVIVSCFGCGDDQLEAKQVPDNLEIDLNQDGIVDFKITYHKGAASAPVDPDPGPLEFIIAKLAPQNNCQILKNNEATSILFLHDVDVIKNETTLPFFWGDNEDENTNTIATISQNFDGETWPEDWNIRNEEIKDSYLVGFRLLNNTSPILGHVELSIDNKTGLVEILSIEFV